jgi:hypothetical protein
MAVCVAVLLEIFTDQGIGTGSRAEPAGPGSTPLANVVCPGFPKAHHDQAG